MSTPGQDVSKVQMETVTGKDLAVLKTSPAKEESVCKSYRGTLIKLYTNHIKLVAEKKFVFEYAVIFSPCVDSCMRRHQLVNAVTNTLNTHALYDGDCVLYLQIQFKNKSEKFTLTHRNEEIKIVIIFKKQINDSLNIYNTILQKMMAHIFDNKVDMHYFDSRQKSVIHRLNIYPGYAVKLLEEDAGFFVTLDINYIITSPKSVIEKVLEIEPLRSLQFRNLLLKTIVGAVVRPIYDYQTYNVLSATWNTTPRDPFIDSNGQRVTFIENCKRQYNIDIQHVDQPLLICKKRIENNEVPQEATEYLIPELCYVIGPTEIQKRDTKLMKTITLNTRLTPNLHRVAMKILLDKIKGSSEVKEILTNWGLTIEEEAFCLDGHRLPNEIIYFRKDSVEAKDETWENSMNSKTIARPVNLLHWLVLYSAPNGIEAHRFVDIFVRLASDMGCRIGKPEMIQLPNDKPNTFLTACRSNLDSCVQLVVCIVPDGKSESLSLIKKFCCIEIPVPSQVISVKIFRNTQTIETIIRSITRKIICNTGGALWLIKFPFTNWMLCGIDTFHGYTRSINGLVASIDTTISRWYSQAYYSDNMGNDYLEVIFMKTLYVYEQETGQFPSNVVIFRKGIPANQLDSNWHEIEKITNAIKQIKRKFNVEINACFIAIQKEPVKKIYAVNGNVLENLPYGTVIDHSVTKKDLPNFFLMAHHNDTPDSVLLTHYVVLHDECQLEPDNLHRLCYKLCHLFYNYPGITNIPAPCKFAKKLATLVALHVGQPHSDFLSRKLFYL